MTKTEKALTASLFALNFFFYLFRANMPELRGDETVASISLLPFFHQLAHGQLYPSFLVFYHEPLQLVFQLPTLFFGAAEFLTRLPNIISGIGTFIVLY